MTLPTQAIQELARAHGRRGPGTVGSFLQDRGRASSAAFTDYGPPSGDVSRAAAEALAALRRLRQQCVSASIASLLGISAAAAASVQRRLPGAAPITRADSPQGHLASGGETSATPRCRHFPVQGACWHPHGADLKWNCPILGGPDAGPGRQVADPA